MNFFLNYNLFSDRPGRLLTSVTEAGGKIDNCNFLARCTFLYFLVNQKLSPIFLSQFRILMFSLLCKKMHLILLRQSCLHTYPNICFLWSFSVNSLVILQLCKNAEREALDLRDLIKGDFSLEMFVDRNYLEPGLQ